jgi:hypothetical protein
MVTAKDGERTNFECTIDRAEAKVRRKTWKSEKY